MVYPEPDHLASLDVCSVIKTLLMIYELPMASPRPALGNLLQSFSRIGWNQNSYEAWYIPIGIELFCRNTVVYLCESSDFTHKNNQSEDATVANQQNQGSNQGQNADQNQDKNRNPNQNPNQADQSDQNRNRQGQDVNRDNPNQPGQGGNQDNPNRQGSWSPLLN